MEYPTTPITDVGAPDEPLCPVCGAACIETETDPVRYGCDFCGWEEARDEDDADR